MAYCLGAWLAWFIDLTRCLVRILSVIYYCFISYCQALANLSSVVLFGGILLNDFSEKKMG